MPGPEHVEVTDGPCVYLRIVRVAESVQQVVAVPQIDDLMQFVVPSARSEGKLAAELCLLPVIVATQAGDDLFPVRVELHAVGTGSRINRVREQVSLQYL